MVSGLTSRRERQWREAFESPDGGAWQLNGRLRARAIAVHRWMGRIYVAGVLAGGLGGLALARTSQEGVVTHIGFGLLAVLWLTCTIAGYLSIRRWDEPSHRAWMNRSYALTLAAVTLRIYLPLELALGMPFPAAYRVVSWLCWVPNLAVAEWVVLLSSRRAAVVLAGRDTDGRTPCSAGL